MSSDTKDVLAVGAERLEELPWPDSEISKPSLLRQVFAMDGGPTAVDEVVQEMAEHGQNPNRGDGWEIVARRALNKLETSE